MCFNQNHEKALNCRLSAIVESSNFGVFHCSLALPSLPLRRCHGCPAGSESKCWYSQAWGSPVDCCKRQCGQIDGLTIQFGRSS
jgi:hypothetical protein